MLGGIVLNPNKIIPDCFNCSYVKKMIIPYGLIELPLSYRECSKFNMEIPLDGKCYCRDETYEKRLREM